MVNLSHSVAEFDVVRRVIFKFRLNWIGVCEALIRINLKNIIRNPTMVQDFDTEVSRIMDYSTHSYSEEKMRCWGVVRW